MDGGVTGAPGACPPPSPKLRPWEALLQVFQDGRTGDPHTQTHTHNFYVPGLTTGGRTIQKPKTHTVVGDEGGGSPELEGSPPAGPGAARGPADGSRGVLCGPAALPFQPPLSQAERTLGLVTAY